MRADIFAIEIPLKIYNFLFSYEAVHFYPFFTVNNNVHSAVLMDISKAHPKKF